jgi:hypothetical protein
VGSLFSLVTISFAVQKPFGFMQSHHGEILKTAEKELSPT